MADITGTNGFDKLTGTDGADTIRGLEGDDWLRGRDGDDVLVGGRGSDLLVAGEGVDRLYGGIGADTLVSNLGGGLLNGGGGDDEFLVNHYGENDDVSLTLTGGGGNDVVWLSLYSRLSDIKVKTDAGADLVQMMGSKGKLAIDLGGGADEIYIASRYGGGDGPAMVAGFDPGAGGDNVDIASNGALLDGGLVNYAEGDNPFATGHLRLVQRAAGAALECDGGGEGDFYHLLLLFRGMTVGHFTADNFSGFDPFAM